MTEPLRDHFDDDDDMPDQKDALRRSSTELAEDRTNLAIERSRMAAERTTMGYLRTAVSLIGFGFSIPTFFQIIKDVPGFEDLSATRPRILGLSLLFLAVVMLITALAQQSMFLRRLSRDAGRRLPPSIAWLSSIAVLVIAIYATFNILTRIGPA